MSIAGVANQVAVGSVSTHAITSAIDTTGADCLLALGIDYGGSSGVALTDSKSNTWVPVTAYGGGFGPRAKWYYCLGPVVGSGHTANFGGTDGYSALSFLAYSGVLSVAALDLDFGWVATTAYAQPAASGPGSPGATPAVDGEMLIFGVGGFFTTTVATDLGAMVNQAASDGANHYGIGVAAYLQSVAALINPTLSWTGSVDNAAAIISLKPSIAVASANATFAFCGG